MQAVMDKHGMAWYGENENAVMEERMLSDCVKMWSHNLANECRMTASRSTIKLATITPSNGW